MNTTADTLVLTAQSGTRQGLIDDAHRAAADYFAGQPYTLEFCRTVVDEAILDGSGYQVRRTYVAQVVARAKEDK